MYVRVKNLFIAALLTIGFAGAALADLADRIDGIISRGTQKRVQFSINVIKADSAETLYSLNPNTALVPASNMKIITTAAALKYLGPNYQYKTTIGLWDQMLVIIGSGDPLLGDKATDAKYGKQQGWIFDDIAAALKRNGIKTLKGIIVDSSIFDDQRVHPNWPKDQLNRWYACEVSGLNYNGNCIDLTVQNVSGNLIVSLEPKTDFIKIINKVRPISKGKSAVGAYRTLEANKIILKGKCKKQEGPFSVAIEKPAEFFASLSAQNLVAAGISVEGQLVEKQVQRDCGVAVLTEFTHTMADCLARCNKDSFGLAAEALLKTIAANSNPDRKNGGWPTGRMIISNFLSQLGIDQSEFCIDDASGLSRENKLSANAVTNVLAYVYKSADWTLYRDSLAAGGLDGTIRRYFAEEKYKGKVFGKTGYIAGVKSFSGVCTGNGGDYIFSILANDANGRTREVINDIAKAIVDGR
ncbi:MAG TPA: D-alanyl-D-alanine carboxypeptidase/D-alanyl-D-alanine-endopeptidase [Sedimentisphaerales bacterium]|nr:D-alanyl-D-alanine carboxypeptidase/D-alanyl-D-alanine-endopeptidase [Sedimentisphaerales bacterium]